MVLDTVIVFLFNFNFWVSILLILVASRLQRYEISPAMIVSDTHFLDSFSLIFILSYIEWLAGPDTSRPDSR